MYALQLLKVLIITTLRLKILISSQKSLYGKTYKLLIKSWLIFEKIYLQIKFNNILGLKYNKEIRIKLSV
ncbi:hypothetical protein A1OE_404 [Candidatus Endolissoclinum faulkneri L2]|uniref:Uncharacterized protein n=1 Tax=Candidatus Endolissoclinum faulkneri L2 TaxID=1193729 RepID=K7Z3N3_9PROT|nr:hypothetical protein A1OE_404 [Candidatus Endolissoclinum faulkneri L2]